MAGKRHHIIPRFLQKGFASRREGDKIWTWHYRKNANAPVEVSTKDAIVSELFYGKGDLNADDEITRLERDFLAPLMDDLRNPAFDFEHRSSEIAQLVAHLSVRTKLLRKSLKRCLRNSLRM